MGRDGSTYQKVASAWAAMRSVSPVSRHSHRIPSSDTSGSDTTSAPKVGLRRASSDTVITMTPETSALIVRYSMASLFAAAELLIDIVEQFSPAFQPGGIRALGTTDARNDMGDARGLRVAEFPVAQVYIVDDFPDDLERRVAYAAALQQHFKGTVVAFVGELAVLHIVAIFTGQWFVIFPRYEFQRRPPIDEAGNQPGRGDTVHVNILSRHPRLVPKVGGGGSLERGRSAHD